MNTDYSIKLLSDEARSLHGKAIQSVLRHADINKLKERIHIFQNMDIQSLSDKELEANIDEVLSVKLDGGITISTILSEYSLFGIGERFYRVRKLINTNMPNSELKNVSAYWNPPQKYVKHYGRLNKPGESLLYTAFNPYTAICETNLKSGDSFVLCIYEAIKPLRFSWIGGKADYDFNGIKNKKAIEFLETIRQFLVDEFTRVIPEGQESLYRITETIAKTYYASPDDNGWRYPSIKNNFEDNICFLSQRVMYNVKLVGAIIATFNESNETDPHEMKMSVEYVVVGPNMDKYYPYESEKGEEYMEKLFPEFVIERPANN
ncbi:MAG: RES domain-containing protein [Lachnospiraceae bacterium]|nr:RES domain-containing protein [Lachnospiraceae bacterium]